MCLLSWWYRPVLGFNSTKLTVLFRAFSNGNLFSVLHIVVADCPSNSSSMICHDEVLLLPSSSSSFLESTLLLSSRLSPIQTPRLFATSDEMEVSLGSLMLPLTMAVSIYIYIMDHWTKRKYSTKNFFRTTRNWGEHNIMYKVVAVLKTNLQVFLTLLSLNKRHNSVIAGLVLAQTNNPLCIVWL